MTRSTVNKTLVWAILLLTLLPMLIFIRPASPQQPLETILIQPDGSVYPQTAPILRSGNTYTFTDNVYAAIKICKSGIVLNGAGYNLSGPHRGSVSETWFLGNGPSSGPVDSAYTIGVDLANGSVNGVTVENLNIMNFSIGIYMWTQNNTVKGNAVSDNIIGVLISGSNCTITKNYIANNSEGLFFGFNEPGEVPADIVVSENSFEHNILQLKGCQCSTFNESETPHNWDNGKIGNFWSDYNGTDTNNDGIGDAAYVIDVVDVDRYPLMQSSASPPTTASLTMNPQLPIQLMLFVAVFVVTSVAVGFFVSRFRKRV